MERHYVYKTTNILNDKTYIGQRKCPKNKTPLSDSYIGSGWILRSAIKKYGKENFKKELLCECSSKEEVDKYEIYFIEEEKRKGKAEYNICSGGQGGNIIKFFSEEEKEKIKNKIRESVNNFYKNGGKRPTGQPTKIICLNDLKVFASIKEAAEYYNIGKENISLVIRDKQKAKSAGGMIFEKYYDNKEYEIVPLVYTKKRPIVCVETNEIFESVVDASKKMNICRSTIFASMAGRQQHTYDNNGNVFHFKYKS